jgi:hypothetical protein
VHPIERSFALAPEKQLRRGAHRSTRELEGAIARRLAAMHHEVPVSTQTIDEIPESVMRLRRQTSGAGR